jgi:mannose-6-phosphate isomerase-like protein (cupin superfamily)
VSELGRVEVLHAGSGPEVPLVEHGGSARAIVWPGMGARLRSMHRIELAAGGATTELTHPSDAVYYVIAGAGKVTDDGEPSAKPLVSGSMVYVERGTAYRFTAGADGLELVGGPAPADPALYRHLGEER